MNESMVTKEELADILETFSLQIVSRFSHVLKHQNQIILDYCNQCIESITHLQLQESQMLTAIDSSLANLNTQISDDLKKLLRPPTNLRSMVNRLK